MRAFHRPERSLVIRRVGCLRPILSRAPRSQMREKEKPQIMSIWGEGRRKILQWVVDEKQGRKMSRKGIICRVMRCWQFHRALSLTRTYVIAVGKTSMVFVHQKRKRRDPRARLVHHLTENSLLKVFPHYPITRTHCMVLWLPLYSNRHCLCSLQLWPKQVLQLTASQSYLVSCLPMPWQLWKACLDRITVCCIVPSLNYRYIRVEGRSYGHICKEREIKRSNVMPHI